MIPGKGERKRCTALLGGKGEMQGVGGSGSSQGKEAGPSRPY